MSLDSKIHFLKDCFNLNAQSLFSILNPYSSWVVLYDSFLKEEISKFHESAKNTHPRKNLIFLEIEAGEDCKSWEKCHEVLCQLHSYNIDRNAALVCLGGGSLGDLTGFVSSLYFRGLRWINIPTTFLSMIDSCFGGKTAINFKKTKNVIGSFHPPEDIIINKSFLKTLKPHELSSSFSELLKYTLIFDPLWFEEVQDYTQKDIEDLKFPAEKWIQKALKHKRNCVLEDPFEKTGYRSLLNFGHSLCHALEAETKNHISHGNALWTGILFNTLLSERISLLSPSEAQRIQEILKKHPRSRKELRLLESCSWKSLMTWMLQDKKTRDSTPRWILLEKIGKATLPQSVSESKALEECWKESLSFWKNCL